MSIKPDEELQDIKARLDRKLKVVDVGCRWGISNIWDRLQPHVSLYGFDADAEECKRLEATYEGQGQDISFVPKALADAAGERLLYHTENAACSSIYKPDPVLTNTVAELECAREVGTSLISVSTLDTWAQEAGVSEIDFLKLDTQGSELDILRGGEHILGTVRALEVEVEFNAIYVGQPLFADVDTYLRARGFVLWKLSTLAHYSDHKWARMPQADDTHFYDSEPIVRPTMSGQLYWAHAHYVKASLALSMTAFSVGEDMQHMRDAALMHVLGFRDLSAKLLAAQHL